MCKVVRDPGVIDDSAIQQGDFGRVWFSDENPGGIIQVAVQPRPRCKTLDEWRAQASHRLHPANWRPLK